MTKAPITFEESIDIINQEIFKRRNKWTLTAIQWMDYQDIAQILRIHINKKWYLWDQTRPIRPWLHALIVNQISNLVRNIYSNHSRPCLRCAAAEGENLCNIYTTQCSACPLYKNWLKTKKGAHDVKLPVALEYHINEVANRPEQLIDIEKVAKLLHDKMILVLKPKEYEVYKYLFIDGKEEEELGEFLGLKTSESARKAGYRQVKNIKDSIMVKVRKMIYGGEVDF